MLYGQIMLFHLAAIFSVLIAPAQAGDVCKPGVLCSRTFYASGPCDGKDHLAALRYQNEPASALIKPWESTPISIVGYRVTLTYPAHGLQYMLAGNSYSPDIMGGVGADRLTDGEFFPSGLSFPFPAAGVDAHLDLHYDCTGATPLQGFYVVYYTLHPNSGIAGE